MKNQIAQIILEQLGGNRFVAMTGARQLVDTGDGLQFGLGRGAVNKANKVRVTLAGDVYKMEFFSIRGVNVKELGAVEMIYADNLARVFTEQTGFDTRF